MRDFTIAQPTFCVKGNVRDGYCLATPDGRFESDRMTLQEVTKLQVVLEGQLYEGVTELEAFGQARTFPGTID